MKRKKVLILIGILLAVTGLGLRIWYVNTHTYSLEIFVYDAGYESVSFGWEKAVYHKQSGSNFYKWRLCV